jgi:hypothetical protein
MGRDQAESNRNSHRKRPKSHNAPNETEARTTEYIQFWFQISDRACQRNARRWPQITLTLFGVEVDLDGGVTPGVEDLSEVTHTRSEESKT